MPKSETAVIGKEPYAYGIRPFLDTGPLAQEVAAMVADSAYQTLVNWLDHIGAPKAAKNLLEAVNIYTAYEAKHISDREIPSSTMEIEYLPIALNAVAVMGGQWHLGESMTNERAMPELKPRAKKK